MTFESEKTLLDKKDDYFDNLLENDDLDLDLDLDFLDDEEEAEKPAKKTKPRKANPQENSESLMESALAEVEASRNSLTGLASDRAIANLLKAKAQVATATSSEQHTVNALSEDRIKILNESTGRVFDPSDVLTPGSPLHKIMNTQAHLSEATAKKGLKPIDAGTNTATLSLTEKKILRTELLKSLRYAQGKAPEVEHMIGRLDFEITNEEFRAQQQQRIADNQRKQRDKRGVV